MIDLVRKGAMMLCLAGTALVGLSSCNDEDPDYSNGLLPQIELPPHVLTGVVSGRDGSLIEGAIVKMDGSIATTDEQGVYVFNDVKPGEYVLQAESEGRKPVMGKVVVHDYPRVHSIIWNAVLSKDIKDEIVVSQTENQTVSLQTEGKADNQESLVQVDAYVPANAIKSADEATITFSPLYNEELVDSRGVSSELMIGTEVSCDIDDVELSKSILLKYKLGKNICNVVEAKKLVKGEWISVEFSIEEGFLIIEVDKPGRYGIFYHFEYSRREVEEPIKFKRCVWNNLYGAKAIDVKNVAYTFKMGSEITVESAAEDSSIWVELLNNVFDLVEVQTVRARYPLNETVKVGFKLDLEGYQDVIIKEIVNNDVTIRIKKYGEVHIDYKFYNREHMGGSN